VLGVDHPPVDLELTESIVDLVGAEFLAPGHQGVTEHLGVDLPVDFEGLKGSHDDVVIVGTSGHLLGEECDHLGEVDGAGRLAHHVARFTVADGPPDGGEGSLEVGRSDDAVLVIVDDAESLFKLLNLFLAEEGEDV
jgi:hypothetical protein